MKTKPTIPAACGRPGNNNQVPTEFNVLHEDAPCIENLCGRVQFESRLAETNGGTQPVKYALLTEAQVALLLLLMTKGHERVVLQSAFKKALIDVFATVRETSVSHRPRKSTKFEIFKALAMAVGIAVIHGQFQTAINLLREVWIKARGASMSGCNQGGVRG